MNKEEFLDKIENLCKEFEDSERLIVGCLLTLNPLSEEKENFEFNGREFCLLKKEYGFAKILVKD